MAGTRRTTRPGSRRADPAGPRPLAGYPNAGTAPLSVVVALDTATDLASIAVGDGAAVLAEVSVGARRHAAALVPGLQEALRLAGADPTAVTRLLFADGPGSFTGLRLGAATMQGFWRARPGISVASVPSLLVAAWAGARLDSGPVVALYDALRGEVYAAVYELGAREVRTVVSPRVTTIDALAASCPVVPTVAVGDGALASPEAIRAWIGRDPVPAPLALPRASHLLALDRLGGVLRPVPDPTAFEPDYGRPAEAQARWERAHGRPLPDAPGAPR